MALAMGKYLKELNMKSLAKSQLWGVDKIAVYKYREGINRKGPILPSKLRQIPIDSSSFV